jgi:aspartate kinase
MEYKFRKISGSKDIAKLSVSGIGLRSHTSVAIAMFKSLADANINVLMINTSELRVNVVIDGKHGDKGLECLQQTFEASLL